MNFFDYAMVGTWSQLQATAALRPLDKQESKLLAFLTPTVTRLQIERCDQEIATIQRQGARECHPAWLIALGTNDWQQEKRLLMEPKNEI